MSADLTRWNRAGLKRLQYVDGNAAVYYERLRGALRAKFGAWPGNPPPPHESDERRRERLLAQYAGERGDWGEELARALARACHVLTGYLDAYANESSLRTATQWDNVRRLVEMLGYHPAPPASASTPLLLLAKEGKRGRLDAGFAVKHAPPRGGAPIVFETLVDLEVDDALNALRLAGHGVSPELLTGTTLELDARVPGLKIGEPVILERAGYTVGRLIAGIQDVEERTRLIFDAPLTAAMAFRRGETRIHLKPADRLDPLGPAQTDATAGMLGDVMVLAEAPRTLGVGEVVYIADGVHAYYRRVAAVDGMRVRLDRALSGPLRLDQAWLSHARAVSVTHVNDRTIENGQRLFAFKAAGDLRGAVPSRLIADVIGGTAHHLREFAVISTKYQPPRPDDAESGHTTFTVEDPSSVLNNPQSVYLPAAAREWKLDSFLYDGAGGLLPKTLLTALPKAASPGDFVALTSGAQLAWAALDAVAPDHDAGNAELTAARWYTRAGGRFYLAQTRVYAKFAKIVRPHGAGRNDTAVSGPRLVLQARPALLVAGRRLWIEQEAGEGWAAGREALVTDLDGDALLVDPPLGAAEGFTVGNTVIRGNVAGAGHGERQNERILGSGNAAALNQSFVLNVAGISFVADATLPAGVRADLAVLIEGRRWTEVATLDDSAPGDAHYVVRMTEEGHVRVAFGDGTRGRRLPSGSNNVRVRYRLGSGLAGNLPPGSLEKPARPSPLIDKVQQRAGARGGGDMEGVASLKRHAPASLLTLERAVSADDYAHLAAAHAAVWRARAFAMPSALRRPRIEVVVVPAGGATLDERLRASLRDFLSAHSLPGVQPVVTEFSRVLMRLRVTLRVVAAEYDPEAVKAQAAARLAEAFALERREIGATLYLSEVFAVVEAIAGVRNSACTLEWQRGGARGPAGQRIDASAREVVFLDAAAAGALQVEAEAFEL